MCLSTCALSVSPDFDLATKVCQKNFFIFDNFSFPQKFYLKGNLIASKKTFPSPFSLSLSESRNLSPYIGDFNPRISGYFLFIENRCSCRP
nr:MAG TPA: hypothetical protein [Caudoviricetes sp.]